MSAIDFVKAHPVATGGVVIVTIIGVVLLTSGGNAAAQAAPAGSYDDPAAAAGLQLQALQIQTSAQAAETAGKIQLGLANSANELEIAKLAAHAAETKTAIEGNVNLASLAVQERLGVLQSSLIADTEGKRIAADIEEQRIHQATIVGQAQAQAAQTAAILANQKEQAEIAARPKGLFSWLFG